MFKQLKDQVSKAKKRAKKQPKSLHYEELEPRVLFSADIMPDLDSTAVEEQVLVEDVTSDVQIEHQAAPQTVEQTAAETRWELVLVNENVTDYEQLIADLKGSDNNRIIEVVVLQSDRDGIEQVSEILAERSDLAAVHVISHGADGQINLGDGWLNASSLEQNSEAVAGWGNALTETGDILFYGCNVAADGDGQVLLNTISDLTGADVAASNDKTGNQDLGGDWELEYVSGIIETDSALNEATQQEWEGLLATYSVADDFSSGDFTGSTGSASWDGPWSTSGGIVLTGGEMRINLVNSTAIRQVDLSSAVSASLSFDFHTGTAIESGDPDSIVIEVSNNGGTDWTILEDIHYFDGANSGVRIYDISSHATATTQIRFRVTNGYDGLDDFFYVDNVEITYSDTNSAPVIASNGGGDTASINVVENTTYVATVTANDANNSDTLTYSVNGGVDCNKFSIDSGTGILTFTDAPDFENPTDTNADNIYEVQVAVFDGNGGTDTQDISVNVSNVSDSISGTAFIDEGGTNIGAGKTINVLVNGVSVGTSVTAADGSFTVDTDVFSAGDAVVLFIDNDATYKGVTITIADGSDLSGVDVFADHVMVRHEGGGALTIADMDAALGAYSDTDIGYSVNAGVLTVTGGELYVPAGHTFTPGGDITASSIESLGTFNGGIGAINISGDLTINGGNFTSTSGILRIQNPDNAGFTVNAGSFNHNSGILEIATPANYKTLTVDIGATLLNDVIVNASAAANLDITGTLDIDGDLTITSIRNMRTGTLAVAGDIVTTDTDVRGDATLLLTGSNAQTINAGGQSGDLTKLTVNKSGGGTVDAGAAGTLSVENLTVSGGTFVAPSGILRIENSDDDAFAVSGGTFSHNSGTVEIATPANYKTLTVDIGATLLNDVIVDASAAANLDITGTLDIDGDLTITSIRNMRTGTLAVAGDIVTTDTDVRGDATLLLTGSNAQTINAGGQSGDLTKLTVNKSGGGTVDAGAAGTLSVENLTVSGGGTFVAPSGILRIENTDDDAFAVSGGTFSHNSGTVEIATPANYKTLTVDIGATLLNDVIVDASAAANLDITGTLDIDGDLTITSIRNMRTGTLAVAGDIVTTDTDVRGDATLLLTGSNAQTINAGGQSGDLTRLTVNKSGGGTVDASAAGTLSVENLTVSNGTFIAPSGILRIENTDDEAFTVSGGTFSHNSGTVEIATPANYKTLTVDIGATLLNDVIVNASAAANLDITGTLDIDGDLTITSINQINDGSINVAKNLTTTDPGVSGTAAMTLDGTGAQTINATGGGDLANGTFTINKASGTVTLLSDLALNGAGQKLTITQGALDLAGFNFTVNDALTVDAGGTLQLEGGETMTTATTTFNAGSTVLYDGAGAYTGLLMGDAYSNLTFDGTGSWTLDNALDVDGNLIITQGTLDLAGFNLTVNDVLTVDAGGTLQLEGDETVTTATTTLNAESTVLYDGAGAYTGLLMGDAYSNLTFNGTGSWTLDNALDVDGNLTITSGTLDVDAANDYPINVAGNWSNSGTFNARGGTVVFDGGNQSLSGSTIFSNLTKIESTNDATDVTLTFDNTATQTITGTLTLDGLDTDDRINLVSDSPTNQWRINLTATATKGTMAFLDVTDSNASGSDASQKLLNPTNSVNGGNNSGWFNSAPTAANNTVITSEDTVYTFAAADFNFSDVDGDTLASVKITSLEAVGSLQLSGVDVILNQVISKADIDAGNLKFVPADDANGTGYDSFGFSVNDGTVDSATSYTITINVTAVNDAAPVANDDAYAVDEDNTLTVDWWDTDWNHRQQLTFDNLAQTETLNDFSVLVILNSSNIEYAQTKDDGSDLRFFAAAGTPLAYEIEQWNEGGDSAVWVRVPQITGNSNSDSIWMYYGNDTADSGEAAGGVWDSSFVGVWHLNEEQAGTGVSGVYKDSTFLVNDGIDRVAATGQEGSVTDGQEFGASDWIEIAHDASLDLKDSMTISFWIKPTSDSGTFNRVVEKGLWGYQDSYYFGGGNGTNDLTFYLNDREVFDTADNVLTVGEWQHCAASYTSNGDGTGSARLYINGVEVDVNGDPAGVAAPPLGTYNGGIVAGNTGRLAIGHENSSYDFDGFIDEVQISKTDRSADWIAAQFRATMNQFGAEFVKFGGEESAPAVGGALGNDTDLDGDPLTVTLIDGPDNAQSFMLNKDGTFTYTPTANYHGSDTFTYEVSDGHGGTAQATATITVNPVNDAPIARPDGVHLSFDGDDFIQVADAPSLQMTSNVTIEAWINHDGTDTGSKIIVNKEGEYEVGITAETGEIKFAFANQGTPDNWAWHNTDYFVTAGEWTHVAVTYDGVAGEAKTYINGEQVDTFAQSGDLGDVYPTFNELWIGGRQNDPADRFKGQIDEVRVWSSTRTQGEIQASMGGQLTGGESGLAGNWRLDEAFGSVAIDQSAFGNDGVLSGSEGAAATPTYQGYSISEDSLLTVPAETGLLANDFDADGDILTVTNVDTTGMLGNLVVNAADGSFTYDPRGVLDSLGAGERLRETFTYTANDGSVDSSPVTVTIMVVGVNDAPVNAVPGAQTVNEDTLLAFSGGALISVTDVDGNLASTQLSVTNGDLNVALSGGATITAGANGSSFLTISGSQTEINATLASLTYQGDLNFNGNDTLTVLSTDSAGTPLSDTDTVTITVDPVNDPPVIDSASLTVSEGQTVTLSGANFGITDPDDSSFTYTVSAISGGYFQLGTAVGTPITTFTSADLTGGLVQFVDDGNEVAPAFSVTVNDGNIDSNILAATINYTAANDAPVANADTASTSEDVALNNIDVLGNDTDVEGDTLSVTGATATNGSVAINPDGTLNYTPNADFNGTDTISYDLADGNGGVATGTLTITVTAVNDNPVANADTATTAEDVALNNIDVLGNDTDVDGDNLSVSGATALNGSVTVNPDNTLNYTPSADFNTTDTISYEIADANGGTSTGTLTITVNPVNDAPVAANDTVSATEDTVFNATLPAATDADGDAVTYSLDTDAANGTAVVNGAGSFSYTPDQNFNGSDSFTYTVSDGHGGNNTYAVNVDVVAVNDAPTETSNSIPSATEGAVYSYTITTSDVDGDALAITSPSLPAWLTLVDNGDGTATLSGTPTQAEVGDHSVELEISDSAFNVIQDFTLTVSGVTVDLPVENSDPDEGGSTTTDPKLFEDPQTDDEQDPRVEVPTYEDPAQDPVIEDVQAPPVEENFTPQGSADADDQLVYMEDPEVNATEEIIYLTDDIDTEIQSEKRDDDHSYIFYDNDLYKDINYTDQEITPVPINATDFSSIDLDITNMMPVEVNHDYDVLRQEIDESFDSELKSQGVKTKFVTITMASFTVGIVSYLIRAGSMVAGLMSSLPIWRGFDPIAIFSGDKKKQKDRNKKPQTDELKSETLFDGGTE